MNDGWYAFPFLWAATEQDARAMRLQAPYLYPVLVKTIHGNLWGYIRDNGQLAIQPQFAYASPYQSNGLAVVEQRGKQGLINAAGQFIVPPVYQSISDFSEGRATVIDEAGFRVIDDNGRTITAKPFAYIGSYSNGLAVFSETNAAGASRYGYLDLQGRTAIPAQYEEAGDFAYGKALVKIKDNEYALINPSGKPLVVYRHPFVGPPGDGLLAFREKPDGAYGYLHESGRVAIAPRFTGAQPFEHGRAIVNAAPLDTAENRFGLIDKAGAFLLQPNYNDLQSLGERRYAAGTAIDPQKPYIGSRYALADDTGRLLTPVQFTSIGPFSRGFASVSDGRSTYWINPAGQPANQLPKLAGDGSMRFLGNLIEADIDMRLFYYDLNGRAVWKPNTVIRLNPPYAVREAKYRPNRNYIVYVPQIEGMRDTRTEQAVNHKLRQLSAVKPVPPQEQLEATYFGDYADVFYRGSLLVLELSGYHYPFGAAHGMPSREYVNLNLATGEMYKLSDLFRPGSPYEARINAAISYQIAHDPQYDYVFPDSFKGIGPDPLFYVTADALHIVFPPYEIAPYAAGFPTFAILFTELSDIIRTNGTFWKSFH